MKKKYPILVIILMIVCIAPFLLTRPAICENLCFTETGQIGDTIGGITSPIIGVCSIILLFLTLRAQLNFNKSQVQDNSLSQILYLQSEIIQMDERISYSYFCQPNATTKSDATGVSSLEFLCKGNDYNPQIGIYQAKCLISQLGIFISLCNCYRDIVLKGGSDNNNYLAFIKEYENPVRKFLTHIIDKNIGIIGNLADNMPIDGMDSEIDSVRDAARKILTVIAI